MEIFPFNAIKEDKVTSYLQVNSNWPKSALNLSMNPIRPTC